MRCVVLANHGVFRAGIVIGTATSPTTAAMQFNDPTNSQYVALLIDEM